MNRYQYPQFVKADEIKCYPQNEEYRYYLDISLKTCNEENKMALIIMQNPSKARKGESDRTVNKVLNYLYEFGYDRIIIANVVPFYGTDIADILNKDYKNGVIIDQNCKIIESKCDIVDKIFVAWGWIYPKKISKELKKELEDYYSKRIYEIKKCLRNREKVCCYCINSENKSVNKKYKQPRHALRWGEGKKEKDFKIIEFNK